MKIEKEKVVMTLVNAEQNKDLLSAAVHRKFLDLAIVYCQIVNADETQPKGWTLLNSDLKDSGLTENELYNLAMKNTPKFLLPEVLTLPEVMTKILIKDGMPEEDAIFLSDSMSDPDHPVYVISNKFGNRGAVNMLIDGVLSELANKLESDLCILPSSIHEVLVVPFGKDEIELKDYAEMVRSVNQNEVSSEERLSDNVYYYSWHAGIIIQATGQKSGTGYYKVTK